MIQNAVFKCPLVVFAIILILDVPVVAAVVSIAATVTDCCFGTFYRSATSRCSTV
jgi:hypothetical protein